MMVNCFDLMTLLIIAGFTVGFVFGEQISYVIGWVIGKITNK